MGREQCVGDLTPPCRDRFCAGSCTRSNSRWTNSCSHGNVYRTAITIVTLLDLAILGFLKEQPLHGYDLKRRLGDLGLRSVSFGSLYPALKRLDRRHLIEAVDGQQRKKVYQITTAGEARFRQLIEGRTTENEDDRSFNLRVAFFRYLDPETRLRLLERRRLVLADRVSDARASIHETMDRTRARMDRYTVSLIEQGAHRAEADIAWIDELIETEQAAMRRTTPTTRWV